MAEFASKGVAGTALGLGIVGTALGLGNNGNGLLGGLFGNGCRNGYNNNGCGCSEDEFVNRYELQQQQKIATLESQIALRDANTYNDQKSLEIYKYFDGEIKDIRQQMCDNNAKQAVINAKFESAIDVLGSQVGSVSSMVSSLTKTVIPNANVCPGWGDVCVQPTGCGNCSGYNANV